MCEPTRTVCLLFYRGTGLVSRLICWFTRGRYSHVAFQFGGQILESIWPWGVRQRNMERADYDADRFSVDLDEHRYIRLLDWCQARVGSRYDRRAVVRFVTRRPCVRDTAWFCGEYVFEGLEHVSYPLLARTEPWEAHPDLLVRSPLIDEETGT